MVAYSDEELNDRAALALSLVKQSLKEAVLARLAAVRAISSMATTRTPRPRL